MMPKPLLLLAAVTLCCCITTLHAIPRRGCRCMRTTSQGIPVRAIRKIEVIPISGHCRQTEIIITRKNNHKVCINPEAKWVNELLRNLQKKNGASDITNQSTTASTLNF
ncbi:growth-regulated alpha protein [Xiphias gladius]|uniref:growth-regulated alpha protein n=1 Tax=Xiphias gladius TaxID=8245 RepID=UPI001A993B25|nr:growth-regulated alpha protein [Xiphias gladius]